MKKIIVFFSLSVLVVAALAFAAGEAQQPLRPAQKIMQNRAALLKGMNQDLSEGKFEMVAKSADALAVETQTNGNKLPNPLAKDITLALSALAKEASIAAAKKDAAATKTKIGAIKGKCDECHAKIRDKK
jgi:cytochrome c556